MPFIFKRLSIPDVILIEPRIFPDGRGLFFESYKLTDFRQSGITGQFLQDNHSISSKNVLRGLHYQIQPNAQGKLIQCVKGSIYDVAVDIREASPTYGHWVSHHLDEVNRCMLYIPPDFAHGFLVLSETAEVIYKCTKEYSPKDERGIIWNDKELNIEWPIKNPILSQKDLKNHPFKNIALI